MGSWAQAWACSYYHDEVLSLYPILTQFFLIYLLSPYGKAELAYSPNGIFLGLLRSRARFWRYSSLSISLHGQVYSVVLSS
jgi:hypothetical protein